jgi:hypothetical protein
MQSLILFSNIIISCIDLDMQTDGLFFGLLSILKIEIGFSLVFDD